MTDLSPAAQAVMDGFLGDARHTGLEIDDLRENVAAALRAAADQVVPEEDAMPTNLAHRVRRDERQSVRCQLLAIAYELDPPRS